jgi:hypothetical protein
MRNFVCTQRSKVWTQGTYIWCISLPIDGCPSLRKHQAFDQKNFNNFMGRELRTSGDLVVLNFKRIPGNSTVDMKGIAHVSWNCWRFYAQLICIEHKLRLF